MLLLGFVGFITRRISIRRKLTLDRAKIGRSFGHVAFIFHPCDSDRTVGTCSREVSGTSWSAARHRSGAAPPPLARLIRPLHSPISLFPLLALACLTPPPDAARPPRRAPPPAARGLAGRCSAARRLAGRRKGDPPRGGSLAAARGTRPGRRPPPPRAGTAPFTRPRLLRPSPPPPTTTASIPAASAAAAAAESPSGVGDANECTQRLRERRGCSVCPRAGKQVAARALSC